MRTVREVTPESRFEIEQDGQVIGRADYRDEDGRRVFTRVETDPALRGQGIAAELVRSALTSTKDQGLGIVAECPYVVKYLEEHPELG